VTDRHQTRRDVRVAMALDGRRTIRPADTWSPPDERVIWEYRKTWRVPEYLDKAVASYVEKGDHVEFSKVR
jgi:hypothetical protein